MTIYIDFDWWRRRIVDVDNYDDKYDVDEDNTKIAIYKDIDGDDDYYVEDGKIEEDIEDDDTWRKRSTWRTMRSWRTRCMT